MVGLRYTGTRVYGYTGIRVTSKVKPHEAYVLVLGLPGLRYEYTVLAASGGPPGP